MSALRFLHRKTCLPKVGRWVVRSISAMDLGRLATTDLGGAPQNVVYMEWDFGGDGAGETGEGRRVYAATTFDADNRQRKRVQRRAAVTAARLPGAAARRLRLRRRWGGRQRCGARQPAQSTQHGPGCSRSRLWWLWRVNGRVSCIVVAAGEGSPFPTYTLPLDPPPPPSPRPSPPPRPSPSTLPPL